MLLHKAHEIDPVSIGQTHVGKTEVILVLTDSCTRTFEVLHGCRFNIHAPERDLEQFSNVGLIVHD